MKTRPISHEAFKAMEPKLLAQHRDGSGVMGTNCLDIYLTKHGWIVLHHWANGGEDYALMEDPAYGPSTVTEVQS